jgi:CRP/FNR family transcriptional regulator
VSAASVRGIEDPWPDAGSLGPACTYPPGTIVLHQGDPVPMLHLLDGGAVKLVRAESSGRRVLVGFRTTGWLLGVSAATLARPLPVSAHAVMSCELRPLPLDAFTRLRRHDVAVAAWLERLLATEAYEQTVHLGAMAVLDARARLLRFLARLLQVGHTNRPDGTLQLLLALTHDDLAEAIAVSRETVTRELAALDRAGVIRRSKGWLVVPKTSPLIGMPLDD